MRAPRSTGGDTTLTAFARAGSTWSMSLHVLPALSTFHHGCACATPRSLANRALGHGGCFRHPSYDDSVPGGCRSRQAPKSTDEGITRPSTDLRSQTSAVRGSAQLWKPDGSHALRVPAVRVAAICGLGVRQRCGRAAHHTAGPVLTRSIARNEAGRTYSAARHCRRAVAHIIATRTSRRVRM